jgi:glutamate transport system permease protein
VTPGSTAITQLAEKSPEAKIVILGANSQCFDAVLDGRVDAMGGDDTSMAGFLAREPQLTFIGPSLAEAPYGVGIKKGNDTLTAAVDQIIARYIEDGSWQRSYDYWVKPVTGVAATPPAPDSGVEAATATSSSLGAFIAELRVGFATTLTLVGAATVLALGLGLVLASLRLSDLRPLRWTAVVPTEYFRNTPLLVLMYLFTSGLAKVGLLLTPFTAAVLALGLYTSAYVAEIIRSGFATISGGQREAAVSLGLSPLATLRLVILPQALRAVTGPLGTQLVLTIKNSSVAATIAVTDLLAQAMNYNALTFQTSRAFLGVGVAYLTLTIPASLLTQWAARRVQIVQ